MSVDAVEHYLDMGRPRQAAEALAPLLRDEPDDLGLLYLGARVSLEAERWAEAEERLQDVLQRSPQHLGARYSLSRVYEEQERDAECEAVLIDILREYPESGFVYARYAWLMLRNGKIDKAVALSQEAIRHDPDDEFTRTVCALLAVVKGDDARASHELAQRVRSDPDSIATAWTAISVLAHQGRSKDAERIARELVSATPEDQDLLDAIVELRVLTHPLGLPVRPLVAYGWAGSAAFWGAFIVISGGLRAVEAPERVQMGFIYGYLAWAVYTWVYPPLMRRWIRWRGV